MTSRDGAEKSLSFAPAPPSHVSVETNKRPEAPPAERLISLRLLQELGSEQRKLESYVTAYIVAQDRLDECDQALDLLATERQKLEDNFYWAMLKTRVEAVTSLEAWPEVIASLGGGAEARASDFERHRKQAIDSARSGVNPAQTGDRPAIADQIFRALNDMRDVCIGFRLRSKENTFQWLPKTKGLLQRIFTELERPIEAGVEAEPFVQQSDFEIGREHEVGDRRSVQAPSREAPMAPVTSERSTSNVSHEEPRRRSTWRPW